MRRAILAMASALAMDVTAEGVETADQAARLEALAYEFAQGYFFDKPLTDKDAREVVRKKAASAAMPAA
jgi:EAL domain-containing protein (putative c-di-GMP-specific phosphodiesterase class I)